MYVIESENEKINEEKLLKNKAHTEGLLLKAVYYSNHHSFSE
jgi:hypothetical protein